MCFGTRKVANYAKRPLILTLAGGTVSFASAIAQEPDDQPIIRDEPGKVESKIPDVENAFHGRRAVTSWKLRSSHRNWEDLLGIFLGVVIMLAPWITEETSNSSAVLNAAVAGLVVMILAEADLVDFRRWIGASQLVCGAWIAASPLIFGYGSSGSLRIWNLVMGVAVVALSLLELRQTK